MENQLTPEQRFKLLVQERPWEHEPNHEKWVDETTGYACEIRRHPDMLHLCGYVQLPQHHFLFNEDYDFAIDYVHEELTFSKEGRLGFDCAHADDIAPGMIMQLIRAHPEDVGLVERHMGYGTYKTWDVVKERVKKLAKELKDLEGNGEMK